MRRTHGHSVRSVDHLAYISGMGSWNPVFKTVLALGTLALCLAVDRVTVSLAVILSLAVLQRVKGGLAVRDYAGLMRVPLAFVMLGGLAIVCDISSTPAGDWNLPLGWFYVCAGADSARFAFALMLKSLGAVSALYLLALTTSACEFVGVLRRAHLPQLLAELMYLTYRFIFVLLDTHERMRAAAGARLGWRGFCTSCRSFGQTAAALLVVSLHKSRIYYDAMAARGYDGALRFLEEEKPWRATQVAGMAAFWAALALLGIITT